jgi:hypothetical protein
VFLVRVIFFLNAFLLFLLQKRTHIDLKGLTEYQYCMEIRADLGGAAPKSRVSHFKHSLYPNVLVCPCIKHENLGVRGYSAHNALVVRHMWRSLMRRIGRCSLFESSASLLYESDKPPDNKMYSTSEIRTMSHSFFFSTADDEQNVSNSLRVCNCGRLDQAFQTLPLPYVRPGQVTDSFESLTSGRVPLAVLTAGRLIFEKIRNYRLRSLVSTSNSPFAAYPRARQALLMKLFIDSSKLSQRKGTQLSDRLRSLLSQPPRGSCGTVQFTSYSVDSLKDWFAHPSLSHLITLPFVQELIAAKAEPVLIPTVLSATPSVKSLIWTKEPFDATTRAKFLEAFHFQHLVGGQRSFVLEHIKKSTSKKRKGDGNIFTVILNACLS